MIGNKTEFEANTEVKITRITYIYQAKIRRNKTAFPR